MLQGVRRFMGGLRCIPQGSRWMCGEDGLKGVVRSGDAPLNVGVESGGEGCDKKSRAAGKKVGCGTQHRRRAADSSEVSVAHGASAAWVGWPDEGVEATTVGAGEARRT